MLLFMPHCGFKEGAMCSKRLSRGFSVVFFVLFLCFLTGKADGAQPGIAAGRQHSAALKEDGTVWTWGENGFGQLGDDTHDDRYAPVQVLGPGGTGFLAGVKAISSVSSHTTALKEDGTVWAWGYNYYGWLGDGTTSSRSTPVQVLGPGGAGFLTGVKAVAAGYQHTVAVKNDGIVWAWGRNEDGQLGDNTTTDRLTPVQVLGPGGAGFLTGVKAVTAGWYFTAALKEDGTVWAWGYNFKGVLGDDTTTDRLTPVQVLGPEGAGFLTGVKAVDAGSHHMVALKEDGTVWAWGSNTDGSLGNGSAASWWTPVQVLDLDGDGYLTGVKAVTAGSYCTMALKEDGTVLAWGNNDNGRLGDGTDGFSTIPVQVLGPGGAGFLTEVMAVSAGYSHSMALKNDGTVWAWGKNEDGRLGDDTTTERWTPVQVLGPGGAGILDLGGQVTYSYYLPYFVSNDDYWTGVALKDGKSWFTASVTATVYGSMGTVLATEERSLSPRGQTAFMVGSGLNTEGWVKVTSDEPLTGLGFVAMAHDDKLMFDMTLIPKLSKTLYVPHVAQDATWDTTVYICNPNGSDTIVYLTFYDSDGTAVTVSHGYILPANGSGSCPLSALLGDDSHTSGSVRITASQGVAAFALYQNLKTGDRSYAGISAVIPQKALMTPELVTFSYCLPYALSDMDYWTGVGLRNGSSLSSATVTVTGRRQNGTVFNTQTRTIPPSGQTAFMMGAGEGWVRITSNQPLTGLGFVAMARDDKLMFDISFVSEPAKLLYVPHVAQDTTWDTVIYVCNPHDSETILYLTLVRSNGTVVVSSPYTLPASGSGAYPLSAIVGGGAYTSGSIEITTSQEVAAFALYHNLKTGDRSYAGISAVAP